MTEWRHLQLHGGFLDRLPFPRSYEDEWPSNEGPFYCGRGICPNEIEPTLENAPQVANTMLEALAQHNHWQSEARDCQEYQRQQDNTESPMADFPSPTPIDRDEPTDPGGPGRHYSGSAVIQPHHHGAPTVQLRLVSASQEESNIHRGVQSLTRLQSGS